MPKKQPPQSQPDDNPTVDFFPQNGDIHVVPLMGKKHTLSKDCWCHPEQDAEEPTLFIHNLEN